MSTEQAADDKPIRYVLFVCNHNAGRSQMAQAFFERYGPKEQARNCLRRETCDLIATGETR